MKNYNDKELDGVLPITHAIDIFNLPGKFNSAELTKKLCLLHRRKGWLNVHVRELQTELAGIPKGDEQTEEDRINKVHSLNNLLKEQSGITELLKEHNILMKKSIDQLFIGEVQRRFPKVFQDCLRYAEELYESKNQLR